YVLATWRERVEARSVSEVDELELDIEALCRAQDLNRSLKVIPLLPAHAQRVFLDRGLHLELRVLDDLHHLPRLLRLDPFLDGHREAGRAARTGLGILALEVLQAHLATNELLLEDAERGAGAFLGAREDHDRVLVALDGRVRALEVETLPNLTLGLTERVLDLGPIHLGDHIERRHG